MRSSYPKEWAAWQVLKNGCDAANTAEAALHQFGIDSQVITKSLASSVETLRNASEEALRQKVGLEKQQKAIEDQLRFFAGDPLEVIRWMKLKERRELLAESQAHRKVLATAFWLMDIPTLAACVAMTTTAILRLALLAEVYSPRSLIQR